MHKDDVIAAMFAWVLGMCFEHNQKMGIFPTFEANNGSQCASWVYACHEAAHAAVFRNAHPGGSHSDFECELMLKARRLFQPLLKTNDEEV